MLKTIQAVAIYFGCPPQSDTTSEDTYTSTVEHREVKMEFSWDLPLCQLAFLLSNGVMLGSGEKRHPWFDPSLDPARKTSPRVDKTAQ